MSAPDSGILMRSPWSALLGGFWFVFAIGCGNSSPFDMVRVEGKVAYDDGTLIPADRLVVTFNPIKLETKGKASTSGGRAEVNVADGTFDGVTTWKHKDGVVVGRHKVVVQSFRKLPGGYDQPTNAVPKEYTSPSTTPIEIEIGPGNPDELEITINKSVGR